MPFILFLLQFGHLPDDTDLGRLDKSGLKVSFSGQVLVLQCMILVLLTVACYTPVLISGGRCSEPLLNKQ